jgi:hypothetical protein
MVGRDETCGMVTKDSPGERRILRGMANVAEKIGNMIEFVEKEGVSGIFQKGADYLRCDAAKSSLLDLQERVRCGIESGAIPQERLIASETATALAEVWDDLAKEIADARRIELVQRAFLGVLVGDPADPEGTMGLVYLRVARQLTAEDGAVLGSAYKHRGDHRDKHDNFECVSPWLTSVKPETGIAFLEPLRQAFARLMRLRLLQGNETQVHPHWHPNPNGALTPFGVAFCQFLERADLLAKESGKPRA